MIASVSSGGRSIGDHPPILPAITPAIAAAGPKAELDRERVLWRDRDSGVAGCGEPESFSGTGVLGTEFSCDREPLRDLGNVGSSSWGCWILYFRFFRRPPRSLFMKVNWSLISSKAGFHRNRLSPSASSEIQSSGPFLRRQNVGINFLMNSSGINRMIIPTGIESTPRTRETPHWGPLRRWTENACPPTKIMRTCPPTIMAWMPTNHRLRKIPSKMLRPLSKRRELMKSQQTIPFQLSHAFITYFHWLKICIQTNVLNTTVSSSSCWLPVEYPKMDIPAKFNTNVTTNW